MASFFLDTDRPHTRFSGGACSAAPLRCRAPWPEPLPRANWPFPTQRFQLGLSAAHRAQLFLAQIPHTETKPEPRNGVRTSESRPAWAPPTVRSGNNKKPSNGTPRVALGVPAGSAAEGHERLRRGLQSLAKRGRWASRLRAIARQLNASRHELNHGGGESSRIAKRRIVINAM